MERRSTVLELLIGHKYLSTGFSPISRTQIRRRPVEILLDLAFVFGGLALCGGALYLIER